MASEVQKRKSVSWYYETKFVVTAGSEFQTEFYKEPSLKKSFCKRRNFIEAGCTFKRKSSVSDQLVKLNWVKTKWFLFADQEIQQDRLPEN